MGDPSRKIFKALSANVAHAQHGRYRL